MSTSLKSAGLWAIMSIFLFLPWSGPKELSACEACNRAFLNRILGEDSFNSLISQEIRASIASQETYGGNSTRWVNDVLNSNNMKLTDLHPTVAEYSMSTVSSSTLALPQESSARRISPDFGAIGRRDNNLSIPATSFVPQDTKPDKFLRITLQEGDSYIGNGVIYKGFTIDGKIPGPTLTVEEGDVVSLKIVNEGDIVHGASIHAVYSQTSKYLGKIHPGDSASIVFQANTPGIYMYHCAPGGHAIPMHIIFGQYGMIVVKPKKKYELETILNKEPDVEINLVQHEYYASGKDAVDGQGKPMYTAFNGKLFRYIEDPIIAKPGDYVRINFLNAGPNLLSTFHIVGIVWDFAYWQGHPDNRFTGGQTVTAGPSDSWVIEFRMPNDEGNFLMLSHAVGSTDRGALGLLVCDKNGQPRKKIPAEGIRYSHEEMEEFRAKAIRTITPFGIGSEDVDEPVVYTSETNEVIIRIIGNSFYPKIVQVAPGTSIKWINEDVFTFMEGEFSGIHNVMITSGPERFASDLLAHAESHTQIMNKEGEYTYICVPHPYMQGKIIVKGDRQRQINYASTVSGEASVSDWILLTLAALALVISVFSLVSRSNVNQHKTV